MQILLPLAPQKPKGWREMRTKIKDLGEITMKLYVNILFYLDPKNQRGKYVKAYFNQGGVRFQHTGFPFSVTFVDEVPQPSKTDKT